MKLAVTIFFLSILIACTSSCKDRSTFEYFYLNERKTVITKMVYDGKVYFINSYYNRSIPPVSYITPTEGIDHSYTCYFHWENGISYLLSPYGSWDVIENPERFKFRKINDDEMNSIMADKSGKFIRSYGDIWP